MSLQQLVGSVLMFGFAGDSLGNKHTREDINELKAIHARGVILFDHDLKANGPRNITSPTQLKKLIEDLRNELGSDLIVAIDQEGGRVARLNEHNGFLPTMSAAQFAQLEEIDQIQYADRQAGQLSNMGINLNFAPCVDSWLLVSQGVSCVGVMATEMPSSVLDQGLVASISTMRILADRAAVKSGSSRHSLPIVTTAVALLNVLASFFAFLEVK